ncbi:MAG: hypothetical protein RQ731_08090 [Anaerosomatales bacterium]|nr:hypothetical protein [Anaerosomatales bacterium]
MALTPEVILDLREATSNNVRERLRAVDRLEASLTDQAKEIEWLRDGLDRLREERQIFILASEQQDYEIKRLRKERPRIPSNGHAMLDLLDERNRYKAMAEWLAERHGLLGEPYVTTSYTLNARGKAAAEAWLKSAEEAISDE